MALSAAAHDRAYMFRCALACQAEWHRCLRLVSLLFGDDDPEGARSWRNSCVQMADVSASAGQQVAVPIAADHGAEHGLRALLDHLASLSVSRVTLTGGPDEVVTVTADLTPIK